MGSGTDHASFAFYANIPAIDLEFVPDEKKYPSISSSWYPMYHTGYDTFYLMDKLIDPGYKIHRTCTQVCNSNTYLAKQKNNWVKEEKQYEIF